MLSISKWDQIYPDLQVPNYTSIPTVSLKLICLLFSRLLESVCLCPKVIPFAASTVFYSRSHLKATKKHKMLPVNYYNQF
jgi:hypothetical protein